MKWKKFTIETTTQAEDLVSGMLAELGVDGVEIEDKQPISEEDKKRMFIDILPTLPKDDGVAYISFYLEEDADAGALLAQIRSELESMSQYTDVGACRIKESATEDKDWVNNWKEFFQPFTVDDILIKPS